VPENRSGTVLTDERLLQAYINERDLEALAKLIQKHRESVFRTCLHYLCHAPDAEDITQEVFLALIEKAAEIDSNVAGWLRGCAVRKCALLIRSRQNRRKREKQNSSNGIHLDFDTADAEALDILQQCLDDLDHTERVLLVQHVVHDRSQRTLAEGLEITQQAVAKRIHKTLGKLRHMLMEKGAGLSAVFAHVDLLRRTAQSAIWTRLQNWLANPGSGNVFSSLTATQTTLETPNGTQAACKLAVSVLALTAALTTQEEIRRVSFTNRSEQSATSGHTSVPTQVRFRSPSTASSSAPHLSNIPSAALGTRGVSEVRSTSYAVLPAGLTGTGRTDRVLTSFRNDNLQTRQNRRLALSPERLSPSAGFEQWQSVSRRRGGDSGASESSPQPTDEKIVLTLSPGETERAEKMDAGEVKDQWARRREMSRYPGPLGEVEAIADLTRKERFISKEALVLDFREVSWSEPWGAVRFDADGVSVAQPTEADGSFSPSDPRRVSDFSSTALSVQVVSAAFQPTFHREDRLTAQGFPLDFHFSESVFQTNRDSWTSVSVFPIRPIVDSSGRTTSLTTQLFGHPAPLPVVPDAPVVTATWVEAGHFEPGLESTGDLPELQEAPDVAMGAWQDDLSSDLPDYPELDVDVMAGAVDEAELVTPDFAARTTPLIGPPGEFDGFAFIPPPEMMTWAANASSIPEPASLTLVAFGALWLSAARKRRRSKAD